MGQQRPNCKAPHRRPLPRERPPWRGRPGRRPSHILAGLARQRCKRDEHGRQLRARMHKWHMPDELFGSIRALFGHWSSGPRPAPAPANLAGANARGEPRALRRGLGGPPRHGRWPGRCQYVQVLSGWSAPMRARFVARALRL
eukprot:9478583-Pyramimonas_sp.AAC.1